MSMTGVNCKFGLLGAFDKITKTYGFTGLRLVAGSDYPEYYQREITTLKCDTAIFNAQGIKRGQLGADVLKTVTMTEAENEGYLHESARNPEQVPDVDDTNPLLKVDYLVMPFLAYTAQVSGRPSTGSGQGSDGTGVALIEVYVAD